MKQLILGIFISLSNTVFSQTIISGKITDRKDAPLIGASIVINKTGTNNIIAYNISNNNGTYSIQFSSSENEVDIWVRSLGYKTVIKTISNINTNLNFKLQSDTVELEEIIIKAPDPIIKKGDTISYKVDSFAKVQDRTIADALERMPGITILNDGKILYQGKPINKYYIEGLDLLGGKYNLANKNLPHKEVTEVQILENHQPIKILDSLVFSDRAALNIKLKNTYTFTGQAQVGSGFPPLLWDTNITPMLFAKKQQMLSSYQANNIGKNVSSQLKSFDLEDLLEQRDSKDWLEIQQLNRPNFSPNRWLDNNIHLLSGNYLHSLKKDYELRLNISYLNDYQQQDGFTNTLFFSPTDTVFLFEKKNNRLFFNSLETDFTLQRNTEKNYLKNSLKFQSLDDIQQGNISINENSFTQNLNRQYFKLSNKFNSVFPLGKQLLSLNSYIRFSNPPQTLQVNSGQFKELLNNGNPYGELIQQLDMKTLHTNNSISFTKGWKQFSFSPKLGFQLEKQSLNSKITTSEITTLPGIFNNELDWVKSTFNFDLQSQYKKNKWSVTLNTPLNFHAYRIEDKRLKERENLERMTFEPRLRISYSLNALWALNVSIRISNQFGTINQLHYAYILRNYRNIQRINTPLPQIFNRSFSGGINYRNSFKSFFWNIIYTQTQGKYNLLYQTQILENGAIELKAIEQDNDRTNHIISTQLDKFFRTLNTNLKLNASFGNQSFQRILNDNITDIRNLNWSIGGKVDTEITHWFNAEYSNNWIFSKNQIQSQSNNTVIQQNHLLNFNFYPKEHQLITLRTEYIKNNLFSENTENLFADIIYRFSWKKKNIDFELQWNNIFGTDNYRTTNINDFSYVETNFQLRPSQVLFKVRFSL